MLKFILYALFLWFLFIVLSHFIIFFGGFFIFCKAPRILKKLWKFFKYLLKKLFGVIVFISPVFYVCYYTILQTFHKNSIREPFDFGHYAVDNPLKAAALILQMILVMFLPVLLAYTVDFTPIFYKLIILSHKTGFFLFIESSFIDNIVWFYGMLFTNLNHLFNIFYVMYQQSFLPGEVLYFKQCCLYTYLAHGKHFFDEALLLAMLFNLLAIIFYCLVIWYLFVGFYLYFIESYRGWPLFVALYREENDSTLYALAVVYLFLIIFL